MASDAMKLHKEEMMVDDISTQKEESGNYLFIDLNDNSECGVDSTVQTHTQCERMILIMTQS